MKTSIKPRYKPLKQKTYCCVPTCIQMILERRGIKYDSQANIGWELGLIVPKKYSHNFNKVRTGKKPKAGYGTRCGLKKYSLNNYFKKYGIPLKANIFKVGKIKNVKKFIVDNIKSGNDIEVCFYNEKLFDSGKYGHVCLIQNIDRKKEVISLVDPQTVSLKKVNLNKLLEALNYHEKFSKMAGFIIFNKLKEK